jgi:hypothetical protein
MKRVHLSHSHKKEEESNGCGGEARPGGKSSRCFAPQNFELSLSLPLLARRSQGTSPHFELEPPPGRSLPAPPCRRGTTRRSPSTCRSSSAAGTSPYPTPSSSTHAPLPRSSALTNPPRLSQALQRRRDQEQRAEGHHLQRLPAGGRRHADHRGEAVRQGLHLRQGTVSVLMPSAPALLR